MTNFNESRVVYAIDALRKAGAFFHSRGWAPATSGNYSARVDEDRVLMTSQVRIRASLRAGTFLLSNLHNEVLAKQEDAHRPSAEALLHLQLYQKYPGIGSVLHTFGVFHCAWHLFRGTSFVSEGLEMHKALTGFSSHEERLEVPIVDNTQDMDALTKELEPRLPGRCTSWPGYLIRGHGVYAWGESVAVAKRHIEGLEFIFETQMLIRRMQATS